MLPNNLLNDILTRHAFLLLDGAMATELEGRGCNLADSLWSAKVLLENPELIYQVHLDYYRAGAQCATTASYQATPAGFAARGLSEEQSLTLIAKSVELASRARADYLNEQEEKKEQQGNDKQKTLLVAGSIGPYGAYLADGSEYRGDYSRTAEVFQAFHQPRITALKEAGADILACETLPSFPEICALGALLDGYPELPAWFSFTLRDSRHLSDGTPLSEVIKAVEKHPNIVAVGINCIALEQTTAALQYLQTLTSLPLVVYPNSGEHYDAVTKTWHSHSYGERCSTLEGYLPQWLKAGARLIGGCCRTTPKDIAALAAHLS